jgi:glycosyltransferase involved in cell wall biosynthesis
VVPPADARALSDALSWLLADTQRRRALGEAAARVSAHFTSRAMLEALAEVYTETATAARPGARRERPGAPRLTARR